MNSPSGNVEKILPDRFLEKKNHTKKHISLTETRYNSLPQSGFLYRAQAGHGRSRKHTVCCNQHITHSFERLPRSRKISDERQPMRLLDRSLHI